MEKTPKWQIKPNAFIYCVAARLYAFAMRIAFGMRFNRKGIKKLQGPCLVVVNHEATPDFGAVAACMLPYKLNFVVSSSFFQRGILRKLLPYMGCISKKQFMSDMNSVRKMLRVVKAGGSVAIFPEGQLCYSGATNDIDPNIGQLAKLLGVQVVNVQIRGHYLTWPKWLATGQKTPRRVDVTATKLLTAEQVAQMTAEEIADIIIAAVSFDDYEWAIENNVKSRVKRRLEGLDNVLYICPVCGSMGHIVAHKNTLCCDSCGYKVVADRRGVFTREDGSEPVFATPSRWFEWQSEKLGEQLTGEDTPLPYVTEAQLMEASHLLELDHGYCHMGSGELTLTTEGVSFVGTRNGEPFSYRMSPAVQRALTFSADHWCFDIVGEAGTDTLYGFKPPKAWQMTYIVQLWLQIRKKFYDKK